MVPMAGLEPARLSPLPPQDSVSTKFHHIGIRLRIITERGGSIREYLRRSPAPVLALERQVAPGCPARGDLARSPSRQSAP